MRSPWRWWREREKRYNDNVRYVHRELRELRWHVDPGHVVFLDWTGAKHPGDQAIGRRLERQEEQMRLLLDRLGLRVRTRLDMRGYVQEFGPRAVEPEEAVRQALAWSDSRARGGLVNIEDVVRRAVRLAMGMEVDDDGPGKPDRE